MIDVAVGNGTKILHIPKKFSCYEILGVMDHGACSVVMKAKNLKTGTFYACKVIPRDGLLDNGMLERVEQELRIQQSIDHPNIAKIINVHYLEEIIIIVLECYEFGNLLALPLQNICHTEAMSIIRKIISAIAYLHSRNIAHRDIKPENIVLAKNMNPMLIDFGACVSTTELRSTFIGTPLYVAPEIYFALDYDAKAADIWSFGVTCFVLVNGFFPWTNEKSSVIIKKLKSGEYKIPDSKYQDIDRIIKRCLVFDPERRATASELSAIVAPSEVQISKSSCLPFLNENKDDTKLKTTAKTSRPQETTMPKKPVMIPRKRASISICKPLNHPLQSIKMASRLGSVLNK